MPHNPTLLLPTPLKKSNAEENEDHYGSFGLERLLTRAVLTAPGMKQIHVNPVTDGASHMRVCAHACVGHT